MTDRYAGFVVALETDLREDDAQRVIQAIRQIRGVVAVEPVVSSAEVDMAKARVDQQWRERILALLSPNMGDR